MTQEIGVQVGNKMGIVMEVDVDEDGVGWSPYLRIKAELDITKPLMRWTLLNLQGNQNWISFKYERLPNFCFRCGIIKHNESRCMKVATNMSLHLGDQNQYGVWLRAPSSENTSSGKQHGGKVDKVQANSNPTELQE